MELPNGNLQAFLSTTDIYQSFSWGFYVDKEKYPGVLYELSSTGTNATLLAVLDGDYDYASTRTDGGTHMAGYRHAFSVTPMNYYEDRGLLAYKPDTSTAITIINFPGVNWDSYSEGNYIAERTGLTSN